MKQGGRLEITKYINISCTVYYSISVFKIASFSTIH